MLVASSPAGVLYVLAASVLWGTTGTAASFAPQVGPLAVGSFAMGIGGLLQAAVAARALRTERVGLWRCRWALLLGGLAVAVYPLAFYSSMRFAGVAVGTIVSIGSAPIVSAVLERVIDRAPLRPRWALGVMLGIVGAVLLVATRGDAPGSAPVIGILLGVVAGATYAGYTYAATRMMRAGVSRSAAMGGAFGLGGILLVPVMIVTGAPILHSPLNAGVAVYMALVPMFAGYLLFGAGLWRVASSTATTVSLAEPVVAAILAVVVVGEIFTLAGWIGMGLIALCIVVIVLPERARSSGVSAA